MFISFTAAKFKPVVFSVSGFALSYAVNMFILMILCDFCMLPATTVLYEGYSESNRL
jgi:hypothetical protein